MAEKKSPTLKELLVGPLGENKSVEEILDTFKRCSRKGVSIRLESINDVYALDEFNFSMNQLDTARQYMENGVQACINKKRSENSIEAYKNLFDYFKGRKADIKSRRRKRILGIGGD